ncbi:hypothetical protein [Undibacterium pigrum]|uniref:Uncharacterized protein n=1 Tax=Undibacterium pigrum TaxID=401470 RepID=A0A318J3E4_9BURK|nr:hypothetical protein [Undibacterium pigrum]PXX41663.1 hypothetical protein DFR42_107315 [Undibacterium pigrum]
MKLPDHAETAASHVAEAIASNPKTALAVPAITTAIAPLTSIAEIQGYLSIASMLIGIGISLILLRQRWISLQTAEIERQEAEQRWKEHQHE